jgi:4-aminobutyrate aminotransferase-like enzyme
MVYDEAGIGYIDLLAGAGSLNYGHNDARIKEAVIERGPFINVSATVTSPVSSCRIVVGAAIAILTIRLATTSGAANAAKGVIATP